MCDCKLKLYYIYIHPPKSAKEARLLKSILVLRSLLPLLLVILSRRALHFGLPFGLPLCL